MKPLNIFTWNVHGTYMSTLAKTGHNFYIPIKDGRPYNYDGKTPGYEWPETVHEIKAEEIRDLKFDLIIFQTPQQVLEEQNLVLSEDQRKLPKIYIVHSPFKKDPRTVPDKKELLDNIREKILPAITTIVHITKYNLEQWTTIFPETKEKSIIIYHGIEIPDVTWTGEELKAIGAVNNLPERVECGPDIWQAIVAQVPATLYGVNSEKFGGLGPIENDKLKHELARHRVFFNSATASSVPMAMLEAMSVGTPVVTTATTDLPNIIQDGRNGFISNDTNYLVGKIKLLLENKDLALKIGQAGQQTIEEKFSIDRFVNEWNMAIEATVG